MPQLHAHHNTKRCHHWCPHQQNECLTHCSTQPACLHLLTHHPHQQSRVLPPSRSCPASALTWQSSAVPSATSAPPGPIPSATSRLFFRRQVQWPCRAWSWADSRDWYPSNHSFESNNCKTQKAAIVVYKCGEEGCLKKGVVCDRFWGHSFFYKGMK